MSIHIILWRIGILVYREWLARVWCVHCWAGWINMGARWNHTAWHRKSMGELPEPAECKDITWTCIVVKLLESATGNVEHWADVQYLGWWEHWRWPEIADRQRSWVCRKWHGWWHSHLWSIQLSGDEPQHLEPKQHQWIIWHVGLDVQFSRTKKWQLVASNLTAAYKTTYAVRLCYVYFMFVKRAVKNQLLF